MCGCLLHTTKWGPGLQPRHVPWLGIKLATFWFAGLHSIHWPTPARVLMTFYGTNFSCSFTHNKCFNSEKNTLLITFYMSLVPSTLLSKYSYLTKKLLTITVTIPESCDLIYIIMLTNHFPFLFSTSKILELLEIGILNSYRRILSVSQRLAYFLTLFSLCSWT